MDRPALARATPPLVLLQGFRVLALQLKAPATSTYRPESSAPRAQADARQAGSLINGAWRRRRRPACEAACRLQQAPARGGARFSPHATWPRLLPRHRWSPHTDRRCTSWQACLHARTAADQAPALQHAAAAARASPGGRQHARAGYRIYGSRPTVYTVAGAYMRRRGNRRRRVPRYSRKGGPARRCGENDPPWPPRSPAQCADSASGPWHDTGGACARGVRVAPPVAPTGSPRAQRLLPRSRRACKCTLRGVHLGALHARATGRTSTTGAPGRAGSGTPRQDVEHGCAAGRPADARPAKHGTCRSTRRAHARARDGQVIVSVDMPWWRVARMPARTTVGPPRNISATMAGTRSPGSGETAGVQSTSGVLARLSRGHLTPHRGGKIPRQTS
jgi:hypothetical protein